MSLTERCARLPVLARRLVALVIAPLVVIAAAIATCAPMIYAIDSHSEWLDESRRLLAEAKNAEASGAELDQQIATMRSSALWSRFYAPGGGATVATLLHSDLGALLGGVRASIQSLTPIAAEESPLFIKVGARVTTSMRADQLQDLMAAIASYPRYLRIERLTIVAPQMQPENENPPLAVTAEIYGYERRADDESPAPDPAPLALSRAL